MYGKNKYNLEKMEVIILAYDDYKRIFSNNLKYYMNLNKLLLLRRKLRYCYYSHYNKIALKLSGAYIGDNFTSLGKIHLEICKGAVLKIGNSCSIVSGDNFNPLARNINAGIWLER